MAYAKSKSSKSSKSVRKYKKNYTRSNKSSSRTFTKKVQAVIHKNIENKCFQYNSDVTSIVNYNNLSWATLGWGIPLSPYTSALDIPIGTGQGARIGNSISIRKLTFKGVISPAPYNSITNTTPMPNEVKFWIVSDKLVPSSNLVSGGWTTFFQNGSSSSSFSSNLLDMIKTPNQDRYVIHTTKTFKVGYAAYEGSGSAVAPQFQQNNDFKLNNKFSMDLTKYMVKNVKYNDASQIPTTRGLFLVMEAIRADGTYNVLNQSGEYPVNMLYQLNVVYEDA